MPVRHNEKIAGCKRTMHRQYRLKSSKRVDQVIKYVTAVMIDRHKIKLHALMVMANHIHYVMTDPHGKAVDFYREAHSNIAKALNRHFKEEGSVWNTNSPSRVACMTDETVVNQIAYAMANPVAAFLIPEGYLWPGIRRAWPAKAESIKRPNFYFKDESTWPESVNLVFERPPGFDELSDEELVAKIAQETEVREEAAREEAQIRGIRFVGRKALKKISRYAYPRSQVEWFQIVPHVASTDAELRIARIREDQAWHRDYDAALIRWNAKDLNVVFPYGTYQVVVHHKANVEPPPT